MFIELEGKASDCENENNNSLGQSGITHSFVSKFTPGHGFSSSGAPVDGKQPLYLVCIPTPQVVEQFPYGDQLVQPAGTVVAAGPVVPAKIVVPTGTVEPARCGIEINEYLLDVALADFSNAECNFKSLWIKNVSFDFIYWSAQDSCFL